MGLSETNVDWKQAQVALDIATPFKKAFRTVHFKVSTSDHAPLTDLSNRIRAYKPGGTVTITTGKYVGRIEKDEFNDPLGNFSTVTLKGRNGTALTIVTAYRVVQSSGTQSGSQTAYQQQCNLLRSEESNPDPRQRALQDLRTFISNKQAKGNDIVLLIDANESTDCRNSGIERLRTDLDLIDLHRIATGLRRNQQPTNAT
jgi:hypothetical protein